jgi:hypothetical protein
MISIFLIWFCFLGAVQPETASPPTLDPEVDLPGYNAGSVYRGDNGRVWFQSDAPLEVIEAQSGQLRGIINPVQQTFAWTVEIKTFNGFNSPLQREHFNEAYLESNVFPKATFSGKIIEKIDYAQDGTYPVRAKGKLVIHGVEQERIIKSVLEVKGKRLFVRSTFTVPLTDHNIAIPKIVHQKIAEEVMVTITSELVHRE